MYSAYKLNKQGDKNTNIHTHIQQEYTGKLYDMKRVCEITQAERKFIPWKVALYKK